jgi:hypothetical protein
MRVRIRKWFWLPLALLAAAALGAAIVFIAFDRIPVTDVQPPGCTLADKDRPGCRIAHQRVTNNTITLVAAIVGPLATLSVAMFAVGSGRRRQEELLQSENQRQEARLADERDRIDIDQLRTFIDDATSQIEQSVAALQELRRAVHAVPSDIRDADYDSAQGKAVSLAAAAVEHGRLCNITARQFDLRLEPDHPVRAAYRACVAQFDAALRPLLAVPPIAADRDVESDQAEHRTARTHALYAMAARTFFGVDRNKRDQRFMIDNFERLLATAMDLSDAEDPASATDESPPEPPTP